MTSEEQAAIDQLRDQYDSIHDNLDTLLQTCVSGAQKRQVGDALQTALKNYIDAQNHILGKSADLIQQVSAQSAQAQQSIDQALQGLQDIKTTLNAITAAVNGVATVVAGLA